MKFLIGERKMSETPVGYFPDYGYQWAPIKSQRHSTEILRSKNGREQRLGWFPTSGFPGYRLSTTILTQEQRGIVFEFLNSHRGSLLAFNFFRPDPSWAKLITVGNVSGATSIQTIYKQGTYSAVYVNGVSKTFTVTPNVGPGGEDRINFTGGAQTGSVTANLTTGRERIVARSENDEFVETWPSSPLELNTIFPDLVIMGLS
jgi:hypothetical protein